MLYNKILILEDDMIVGIDLQELLNQAGYDTVLLHNYNDAISHLKSFKPNLAICDINLGQGETGIDFAKYATILLPTLEIIYVTAFSTHQIIEKAESTQPLNYIIKPWNEEQIKVTVKRALSLIKNKYAKNEVIEKLSLTEYKILDLISQQKKSKEIAIELFVSEKTIRNHRYNIIKKLKLPNENNSLLKWALTNLHL
ncbi:MAG: DNA-binding response regulator [Chitinophagia bacterium]|jgi:DNA-binding NarL/FixJ family response regulator